MSDFSPTLLQGLRFAVLGLGRNGAAAAARLAAMGADVRAWDDSETGRASLAQLPAGVELAPITDLGGYTALVMSPGIPHSLPTAHPVATLAINAGVAILSDAELLYRVVRLSGSKARFAAITGTNGKSTTTVLLAHLLAHAGIPVAAGGNLGPAALSLPYLPDNGVYVLEMSSYMLERLADFHADAACLLNLTPDHLDRHGDMAGYARAKAHVFDHQGPGDLATIGISDPWCRDIAQGLASSGITIATISGVAAATDFSMDGTCLHDRSSVLADLAQAPALPGAHNAENAAAAAAMALHFGVPRETLQSGLSSFGGLPHRQKMVGEIGAVRFIDDSKATNADATSRALMCYEKLVWIAGGIAKEGGIDSLAPYFGRIARAFLIGRDAPMLAATLRAHDVPFTISDTLDAAVPAALALAQTRHVGIVLLSPACASFDQFRSFEHRGQHFIDLVKTLADHASTPSAGA